MSEKVVLQQHDNHVFVIEMRDEARRNALSDELVDGVVAQLLAAEHGGARAIVLTGAGSAFSAGGDLDGVEASIREAHTKGRPSGQDMHHLYRRLLRIREAAVPVVAAVNGHAIGAGAALLLACDLSVVSATAQVGFTFVRLGIHPGLGATWLLPRLVGSHRAAELLLTAATFRGEELERIGLANRVVEPEHVRATAIELATMISANGPVAIRQLKHALTTTWMASLEAQTQLEIDNQMDDFCTDDALEGVQAVRERRSPVFTGR